MAKMAGTNSAVREMFEEGNRLKALYGPENVYDFSIGNPYFPAPASVKTAIVEILETMDSSEVSRNSGGLFFESMIIPVSNKMWARMGVPKIGVHQGAHLFTPPHILSHI